MDTGTTPNQLGKVRDRSYEDQQNRASGLNLIVASIILWNTVYLSKVVDTLKEKGMNIQEEFLHYVSPLGWEHISITRDYVWNLTPKNGFK